MNVVYEIIDIVVMFMFVGFGFGVVFVMEFMLELFFVCGVGCVELVEIIECILVLIVCNGYERCWLMLVFIDVI